MDFFVITWQKTKKIHSQNDIKSHFDLKQNGRLVGEGKLGDILCLVFITGYFLPF